MEQNKNFVLTGTYSDLKCPDPSKELSYLAMVFLDGTNCISTEHYEVPQEDLNGTKTFKEIEDSLLEKIFDRISVKIYRKHGETGDIIDHLPASEAIKSEDIIID